MKLSIVATLYKSTPYISEFHARASSVASRLVDESYEIILVNDGCPDGSLEVAKNLLEDSQHTILVDLSRNFGHHKAMMAGLQQAKGEMIFLIDSDLEEEPEYLLKFFQEIKARNCDVVFGVQDERKGGFFEKCTGALFYQIFNSLTKIAIPKNLITARLMTRRYVNALLQHNEREVTIAGLWHLTGFEQIPIVVQKHSTSNSTYNLKSKVSALVNAITSFSNAPLVYIFYLGVLISALALLLNIYLVINWLFFNTPLAGWTSVIASIWLIGGMVISFIGVIGVYLAKIYSETKQRPRVIIRDIFTSGDNKI